MQDFTPNKKNAIKLISLSFFLVAVKLLTSQVFAQNYQSYLSAFENYKTAYQNYITTRSQYLTYGTLNSKNDALEAVGDFLIKRDALLISYFSLLNSVNADSVYSSLLSEEINFLNSHSLKIPALATLEDTVTVSQEVEARNIPWQILARKIVATLIMSKINGIKLGFTVNFSEASNLVATLKSQNKEISVLERWLLEAKNKQLLAEQKLNQVAAEIPSLTGYNENGISESYHKIYAKLLDANQYLREAFGFLKEISETVKYGEF